MRGSFKDRYRIQILFEVPLYYVEDGQETLLGNFRQTVTIRSSGRILEKDTAEEEMLREAKELKRKKGESESRKLFFKKEEIKEINREVIELKDSWAAR